MKITGLRTWRIHLPFDRPIGTAIHRIDGVSGLLVWLETDEGITGESYLWAIGRHRVPVLEAMVRLLGERVVGLDPRDTTARFDEMWNEINFLGHKGVSLFGVAAIDWACWDILGQSLGASVSRLLGRRRDRVPTYASGGLWASMTIAELEAQAKDFVSRCRPTTWRARPGWRPRSTPRSPAARPNTAATASATCWSARRPTC